MADKGRELLAQEGWDAEIEAIEDSTAIQKGAALLLWAETEGGCLLGFDMAGKLGRSSEAIAKNVVRGLLSDISTGATVDRFAADQLILFAGLAAGTKPLYRTRPYGSYRIQSVAHREDPGREDPI